MVIFEIDDNFEIIKKKYYVIKCEKFKKSDLKKKYDEVVKDGIINLKYFIDDCDRIIRKNDFIANLLKDCEYVAIEGYSFGSQSSNLTKISENTGYLKMNLYKTGCKIRIYDITSNKKHFSSTGGADKDKMIDRYLELGNPLNIDLSLKEFDRKSASNCLNDIVDAYAICDFLLTELKLRHGLILLKDLPQHKIECYNKIRKDSNEGLLTTPFINKDC